MLCGVCVASCLQSAAWPPDNFSSLSTNEYLDDLHRFKAPRVLQARARGFRCFDFDHYMRLNPDLKSMRGNLQALWRHYVYYGQFDARPHR